MTPIATHNFFTNSTQNIFRVIYATMEQLPFFH